MILYQVYLSKLFFRAFSAIIFGGMAIGNASAFAPDAAKAEESAKQIFKLIDLVPQVDAESEEGTKLDKVLLCGLIN